MNAPRLLFINKTAQSDSLSHSTGKAGARISSHVQRNRRWRNTDNGIVRPETVKGSPKWLRPAVPMRSNEQCEASTNSEEERGKHGDIRSISQPGSLQILEDNSPVPARKSAPDSGFLATACFQAPSSIIDMPQSVRDIVDPFNTTCITVDQVAHKLLQYYLNIVHPSVWYTLSNGRNGTTRVFQDKAMGIMQGCLTDEYDMYCMLASMNVHLRYLDGYDCGKDDDYFIVKAIQVSQKHMQQVKRINDRMIFNVFQLSFAEWYRDNQQAALIHFRAVASMVQSIGGLRVLAGPIADLLLLGDGYISGELKTKPLFSYTAIRTEDDSAMKAYARLVQQTLLSSSASVAAGFLTVDRSEIMSSEMRSIILDLAVAVSILNEVGISQTPSVSEERSLHWINHQVLLARHQLLSFEYEDPRTEGIRLAIILWILQCCTRAGRIRSTKRIAPQLRKVLQPIPEGSWACHNDIELWVLIVGAISARTGSDEHTWFVQQISCLTEAELAEYNLKDRLVDTCQRFFYREVPQGHLLVVLAQSIVNTRNIATIATKPVL